MSPFGEMRCFLMTAPMAISSANALSIDFTVQLHLPASVARDGWHSPDSLSAYLCSVPYKRTAVAVMSAYKTHSGMMLK
jgi:hypothetical protein